MPSWINYLGDNPIYKVLDIITGVGDLEPQLEDNPFLGHGKITVMDNVLLDDVVKATEFYAILPVLIAAEIATKNSEENSANSATEATTPGYPRSASHVTRNLAC